ncbi:MAG: Lrp/AsnC family transcriptional regulator [Bacteroidota bacterium]
MSIHIDFNVMNQLDATDLRILDLLQHNSKLTTKEIAAQIGMTTTPVYERIKRLEKNGYVDKYIALLNREKLGLTLLAFVNVSLKEHNTVFLEKFVESVISLPEVMECYHVAGLFDYLLKVIVKDMEAYQHFVSKKLAGLDNIGKVQSSFVMTEIKHSTALNVL